MNEVRFYLSLFFRRFYYLALIVIGFAVAGVVVAFTLPPVYRAEAHLVVESPQIPGEMASSTVQASALEILEVIQQRMLTRSKLLELSERFDVHVDVSEMAPDEIVEDMQNRIMIDLPVANFNNRASFVRISFAAPTGEMSAAVTNELVAQILEQNIEMRTNVAGQTLEFFVSEVARLDNELAEQGARILEYQEANKDALPDSLEYRRSRQSSLQERVLQLDRELSGLRDRRARLVEIYERTGRPDFLGESLTPEQRQLRQLQDQRASARVIYSQDHPQIRSLDAQIAALEAANIRLGLGTETAPNITAFELQLSDIDGQIEFIEEERAINEGELEKLAQSIEATPGNAITLGTLERDYDNLRVQYAQATASLAEARTGDQIEAQSRGQRITVTEMAAIPLHPADPNRKLIAFLGVVAGLGAAAAVFLLLEILNNKVRRPSDLEDQFGGPIFGTVPYIQTSGQVAFRKGVVVLIVLLPLIGAGLVYYLVQLNYEPIDQLISIMSEKLGIDTSATESGNG
ncbi:MAG: GumC family protein [Ruegeria sp.]